MSTIRPGSRGARDDPDRSEERLRERLETLEATLEATTDGILVVDADGRIVHVNRRFAEMCQLPEEILAERSYEKLIRFMLNHVRDPEEVQRSLERMWASEEEAFEAVEFEDGRVFERYSRPLIRKGRLDGRVCSFRDVTERRHGEKARRREEARLDSIMRAAPIGIGLVSNRVLKWGNDRLCEMVGYSLEEMQDRSAEMLYPDREEFERVGREKYSQISRRGTGTVETKWKRKDGQVIDVLLSSTPFDPADLAAGVTFTALEITDRKRAERESAEARALLLAVIEQMPAGVLVADAPDVRIRIANSAALGIRGATVEPLTDIPVELHPENWQTYRLDGSPCNPEELPLSRAVLYGATSRNVEVIIRRQDGQERHVLANAAPVRNDEGEVVAGVVVFPDITERKWEEEERRKLETQLQHAQKLESLGVLAGGIAHDFNNLLMVILGNADMALGDLPEKSPARRRVEEIITASRRASGLTQQMLAYSGRGPRVTGPISLNQLVDEMGQMLEVAISKKAELRFERAPELSAIQADATQMRQVVMNLITNASEAIGDTPGTITIRTGEIYCERAYLDGLLLGNELPEGDYVFLEVSDTGCGMDEKVRSKIFEPFFTTKFTGRGLGMSAVQGILRSHGGAIDVHSEVGKQTTFRLLFPALDRPPAPLATESEATSAWRGSGRVLLVDDEETVRVLGKEMLERAGFTVQLACDGEEALWLFRAKAEEYVCVVLDLTMPRMDGEECFRKIRDIRNDVPVLLSSGYDEQDVVDRFADQEATAFIHKPYRFTTLASKLRDVIQR